MHKFKDVRVTSEFIKDYDLAPKHVQARVDKKITVWAITGGLTPAAQAHKAYDHDGLWIIYVNLGASAYRILARFCDDGMVLERLLNHEDALKFLNVGG